MIIWILIGIIFLVVGIVIVTKTVMKEKRCNCKTHGRVINVNISSSYYRDTRSHSTFYTPIIKYNIDNKQYEKKVFRPLGTSTQYKTGQELLVFYNPKNHEEIYITHETKTLKIFGVMISIVGLFITISGLLIV